MSRYTQWMGREHEIAKTVRKWQAIRTHSLPQPGRRFESIQKWWVVPTNLGRLWDHQILTVGYPGMLTFPGEVTSDLVTSRFRFTAYINYALSNKAQPTLFLNCFQQYNTAEINNDYRVPTYCKNLRPQFSIGLYPSFDIIFIIICEHLTTARKTKHWRYN